MYEKTKCLAAICQGQAGNTWHREDIKRQFWNVHKKYDIDFQKQAEADTKASLRVSHSIMWEDTGVNIAAS